MKKGKRAFSSNSEFLKHSNKTKEDLDYNMDKNCLSNIKAHILSHRFIHGAGYNEDYIEYWIEIITEYKRWIIKKHTNARKRIEIMCDGTLEISSTPNVGTTVLITIPKPFKY